MEERARAFVGAQEWIFAKTMADIPHFYCLKKKCSDPMEFDWFVHFLTANRAHLQSSVFKLSKDLIDSIHEEGIVAYTS